MVFYNDTGTVGVLITYMTVNVTGSLFITLLIIVMALMSLTLLFRIPLEFSSVIILPLLLVLMAYSTEFLVYGSVTLLYLGVLMAKMYVLR